MFKFAESGIVTWPTTFPVDADGHVVETKVLVRYRPFTRKELAELDRHASQRQVERLAETIAKIMDPLPGGTDEERAQAQVQRAERTLAVLNEAQAEADAREASRTARLLERVVAVQPPGESEFREFAPGELARQLEFEVLAKAYEEALMACSRAAVAKN